MFFENYSASPMVLTVLGYSMIIIFMWLIMTKRLSALVALVILPLIFGLVGGFGKELGSMMLTGIQNIAPTGVMLTFAILYFSIMIDAGLFDFIIKKIIQLVQGDPMRVVVGTTILAMLISLDGDGATCYILTVSAMLPLYKRFGISQLVLTCVIMLSSGVFNILPWGGPTARAASALNLDPRVIFIPMIPSMMVTIIWILFVSYRLGIKERKRVGIIKIELDTHHKMLTSNALKMKRPTLFVFNLLLTLSLLTMLILGIWPLPALFMIFFAVAVTVNYPKLDEQKESMMNHAKNVLPVVSLIFSAGIFVGIFQGTKMIDAIATSVTMAIPHSMGPYLAIITGFLSIPFTFLISNDAFYFGILPILAKAAAPYGITTAEIARASIIGQPVHLLSPLVASTYLLVGLAEVDIGAHQRYTLGWSITASLCMLIAAIIFNVVPL